MLCILSLLPHIGKDRIPNYNGGIYPNCIRFESGDLLRTYNIRLPVGAGKTGHHLQHKGETPFLYHFGCFFRILRGVSPPRGGKDTVHHRLAAKFDGSNAFFPKKGENFIVYSIGAC